MINYRSKIFLKIGFIILPMAVLMIFIPFRQLLKQQPKPVVRLLASNRDNMEISIENVTGLYAASVDLLYDPEVVNVEKLEIGGLFIESGKPWMEFINDIDADEGVARFAVSLMGDVQAIEGTGILVKIYYALVDNEMPDVRFLDYRKADLSNDHEFSVITTLVNDDIEYIPYVPKVQVNE